MSQKRNWRELCAAQWGRKNFLCVGLDPDPVQMPVYGLEHLSVGEAIRHFCIDIVKATAAFAGAYKPNLAFFIRHGAPGLEALKKIIDYIRENFPDKVVILDGKFGDIGNTGKHYATFAFDEMCADAVTVNPYLGGDSLEPFTSYEDKGVIVLCRTSNKGGADLQALEVTLTTERFNEIAIGCLAGVEFFVLPKTIPLYQYVAWRTSSRRIWNNHGNCGLVVGATYPDELRLVRQIVNDQPILIPGIGKQGGDLEKSVLYGQGRMWINVGSSILYASNGKYFAEAAGAVAHASNDQIVTYHNAAIAANA